MAPNEVNLTKLVDLIIDLNLQTNLGMIPFWERIILFGPECSEDALKNVMSSGNHNAPRICYEQIKRVQDRTPHNRTMATSSSV